MTLITQVRCKQRTPFPCLHCLIKTGEGLGGFGTVMQIRDKVEGLRNGLPTPRVFISVHANIEKKFSIAFLN